MLVCTEHDSPDCIHVGYALGVPEVYSLLADKRDPKRFRVAQDEKDIGYSYKTIQDMLTTNLIRAHNSGKMEREREKERQKEKLKYLIPDSEDTKEKEKAKPVST
jgi:hypothetical protein